MKHPTSKKKLAIIGAGAAGMFCASLLAESAGEQLETIIFERLETPMQKLLATGGGRCNLTHNIIDFKMLAKRYPHGEKFLYSVFSQFGVEQTLEWFEKHQLKTYTAEDNSIFPQCDSAAMLADTLLKTAKKAHVQFVNNTQVIDLDKIDGQYLITTEASTYKVDYVLLATGGKKSIKARIRNYNGYELAKKLGHTIIEPVPALAPLLAVNKDIGELAGIVMKNITLNARQSGKALASVTGDLLFTHRGLSGPAAINLSSYLTGVVFSLSNPVDVIVTSEQFATLKEADSYLVKAFDEYPKKNIINIMTEFYPRNVARYLLKNLQVDSEMKVHTIKKDLRVELAKVIFEAVFQVKSIDASAAMVTCGGVSCDEIHARTMASKLSEGLYFAGEVVNVDGLCGGFNLQFAWSSAFAVAKALNKSLEAKRH